MTDGPDVPPAGAPDAPGVKLRLKHKLGLLDDLRLVAYRSYGSPQVLNVKGRLIEARGISGELGAEGGLLQNILTTLHRMESDEIPGARLQVRFADREHDLFTDQEGYFQINLYSKEPFEPGWHDVALEVVESIKSNATARASARVLVPPPDCRFGVVSDLDDTVIKSSATNKLAQARITLFESAESRTPFAGVAQLYQALVRGPDGDAANPIFYISRSGWNLYDLFIEFFDAHDIPPGPMFLRDLAFREEKSSALGSEHHKLARIRDLLQVYPGLPLVLIGDTGQHDAQRYRQIVIENPGRVRAVYLRDVAESNGAHEIGRIAADLERRGVATLVGNDSTTFAEHMRDAGLISSGACAAVGAN